MKSLIVTGGAGFIGSSLIRLLLSESDYRIINVDALTYAGNLESLPPDPPEGRYVFVQADIADAAAMSGVIGRFEPAGIIHLAAESHVDRSITGAADFIRTNIIGTFTLLEAARRYYDGLDAPRRDAFRFLHVSTDEVFGSLGNDGFFTEETPYSPRSPYSASKASSDHLVRAWHHTYGVPTMVTNCSNNYGPFQFPEKLIPVVILNALAGRPIPVYGRGTNIRDWLFVDDHARALRLVFEQGEPGATYNIGGNAERTNLDVVRSICANLDRLAPRADGQQHDTAIEFVADRPGHDHRYAIDASCIQNALGWKPAVTFDEGIARTVEWYLDNRRWWQRILDGDYRLERLGLPVSST